MRILTNIALILICNMLCFQVFAQRSVDTLSYAQITFEQSNHNFGDIIQGQKVEYEFKFKNTGNAPLILQNVLTTCGCTVPAWPKEPVNPSAEGIIQVVFDSTSKLGRQNKLITIRSNSKDGDVRLSVTAMVLPPKKARQ